LREITATARTLGVQIHELVVRNPLDLDRAFSTITRERLQAVSLVSGCQFSAWFILMCIVHEDGKPRLLPAGGPEFRFMLCPAADCNIVDTWTVAGLRAAPGATTSWCRIGSYRLPMRRSTPTPSC
jgi:hypothetical protein